MTISDPSLTAPGVSGDADRVDDVDLGTVDAHATTGGEQARDWWRRPPTDRRGVAVAVASYVAMTTVLTAIGLAVVTWWEGSRLGELDADLNRWLEDRRTESWNAWSEYGSMFSDTITKVVLGAVLLPVFLLAFRRWHDWTFLVGALVLEVVVFVSSGYLVGRDRPPVEQLDSAPTTSFPSGHIAAATVFYVGLAMVVAWHSRRWWIRLPFFVLGAFVPVMMVVSRMYRGMHYLTDSIAGVALGLAVLAVMRYVVARGTRPGELPEPVGAVEPSPSSSASSSADDDAAIGVRA